jgi:thymidylate synthase ThyX
MSDKIAQAKKKAEQMKAAKREKYAALIEAGVPSEIARLAISWGPDRVKKELGVEFPHE